MQRSINDHSYWCMVKLFNLRISIKSIVVLSFKPYFSFLSLLNLRNENSKWNHQINISGPNAINASFLLFTIRTFWLLIINNILITKMNNKTLEIDALTLKLHVSHENVDKRLKYGLKWLYSPFHNCPKRIFSYVDPE